ncbi:c-type cytochrome domain-containing protein [Chitinophaga sp. MM2321]|uniref:c-type cytochrome domain-containing protein n=1 Tax=Chitinophaga sp. MM2321 TaxID=3137178 RepID=UPI0032D57B91
MRLLADAGSWSMFMGRSHPLVVHLPIGILIIAFVLAVLARSSGRASLKAALPPVLLAAAISAVYSCIAGYMLSLDGGYDDQLLQTHQWLGIGVAVISILLYILEKIAIRKGPVKLQLPLFLVMVLLLSAAGHYGGSLTHGEDYLTKAMPPGLRKLTGNDTRSTHVATYTNIGDAKLYEDLVVPVLTERCYGCHNEQKLKGGLRLESLEQIRRGGEHGPVLKDSLPEESELYKRLILSENDEHRMPPKGKPQLAPQELELLYWWIAQGAPTGKAVKDLPKTARIQAVLAGMVPSRPLDKNEFVPEVAVSKASEKSIAALEAKGVKVMPIGAESNYVAVSCINAIDFNDKDMALLLPLQAQLIWLDLSGTGITDAAFPTIAKLSKLTRLELKHTAMKGNLPDPLAACTELRYLNFTGTKIADAGILSLGKNKKLQQIYLYQTGIQPATMQQLQQTMPKLLIDTGASQMEQLASDTTVYRRIQS